MKLNSDTLYRSDIKGLSLISSGKVRDIYNIDAEHILIVTSDRLSAFDVILPDPIPGKGSILTEVSNFWFNHCKDIIPNHLTGIKGLTHRGSHSWLIDWFWLEGLSGCR